VRVETRRAERVTRSPDLSIPRETGIALAALIACGALFWLLAGALALLGVPWVEP